MVAAALASIAASPRIADVDPPAPTDPHVVRAGEALASMTSTERISQLVMTSVPGTTLAPRDAKVLRATRLGGIILFANNYRSDPQLRAFTRAIQAANPGTLISIDQEGGVVRRLPRAAPTRSHPQLGATNRPALTRAQGAATARSLTSLGIQLDLAPVADLDIAPRRVMRERSFGSVPLRVATHVGAFIDGLHDGGGAAAVKHFPGFGGATVNSDDALARVSRTRAQLLAADLRPFRTAVARDVDAVMMSHGVYAAVDRRRPASTSPAAYRLLRVTLGYEGVAITDALHAAGFRVAARVSPAAGCVPVVRAGADIALLTGTLAEAVACRRLLVAAVAGGTIPQARIDEAALRVLVVKSRQGLLAAAPTPAPE
ncbi:MAG: putative beta-N-acetylglucosaminidase [Thermoleophilia bacterium]|nr:putative beta-N-acetylglucosaminidase [Thermoleophilia bacterium]